MTQEINKNVIITPNMMLEAMMGIQDNKPIDIFDIDARINESKAFDVRLIETDLGASDVVTNTGAGKTSSNTKSEQGKVIQSKNSGRYIINEKNKKNEYAGIADAGAGNSYRTSYLH